MLISVSSPSVPTVVSYSMSLLYSFLIMSDARLVDLRVDENYFTAFRVCRSQQYLPTTKIFVRLHAELCQRILIRYVFLLQ